MRCVASRVLSRGRKFVVMKPPSGKPRTELRPMGSGATTQPSQVTTGVAGAGVDLEHLDRLARAVADDEQRVHAARCRAPHNPCVVNRAPGRPGGPGQSL